MSDPTRLLDGDLDAFERELLGSARIDRGSERARRRALSAFGALGVELLATTAAAGSAGSAAAPTLTFAALAKWLGTGIFLGTLSIGGAVALREASNEPAAPPPPSVTERAAPAAQPAAETVRELVIEQRVGAPQTKPVARLPLALPPEAEPWAQGLASSGAFPLEATSSLLAEELARLEAVRRLLLSGDARAALGELARYDAQFPHGALAKEATLLAVETRVAVGDVTGARRVASRIFDVDPTGPHAARLRALLSAKEEQ